MSNTKSYVMDAKQINSVLRQKFPFIQIDRVLELEYGARSRVLKNITMTEPCFQGHFPGDPIFPGVLIIEAMAQAGGFIFAKEDSEQKGFIAAIDKVKFIKPVIPGDTMIIESKFIAALQQISRVNCEVFVDDELVAKGEITYKMEAV
jgi:3-hydroxyacyl-[acyl-carrier-protein] dehydratase